VLSSDDSSQLLLYIGQTLLSILKL
jgi:hypothetical protein